MWGSLYSTALSKSKQLESNLNFIHRTLEAPAAILNNPSSSTPSSSKAQMHNSIGYAIRLPVIRRWSSSFWPKTGLAGLLSKKKLNYNHPSYNKLINNALTNNSL